MSKLYLVSIIAFMIASAGLVGGCVLSAAPETATPPAPVPGGNDIPAASPETDDAASPSTAAATVPDKTVIDSDPVSGRSGQVDLRWQELCLSNQYQVQIANDPDFSIIVVDTGIYDTSAYYPAGGRSRSPSALTPWAGLQTGQTYYWRARVVQAATGQYMRSPWSEKGSFTTGAGLPLSASASGPQPLYPNNGGGTVPVTKTSFTWTPLSDTTKYKFVLAKDAAMTQIIKEVEVINTAYEYDGQLEYGQTYFWRVMAIEPAPSDWSAVFSFRTETAPPPAPSEPAQKPTPFWVWPLMAIGGILIITLIALLIMARRK